MISEKSGSKSSFEAKVVPVFQKQIELFSDLRLSDGSHPLHLFNCSFFWCVLSISNGEMFGFTARSHGTRLHPGAPGAPGDFNATSYGLTVEEKPLEERERPLDVPHTPMKTGTYEKT